MFAKHKRGNICEAFPVNKMIVLYFECMGVDILWELSG